LYLLVAGTFALVSSGLLLAVAAAVQRGGLPAALVAARPEIPAILLQLLIIAPLLTTVTGWWSAVAAVPLLAWSLHLRDQLRRHRHLCREPVSGLLNLHGLKERLEGLVLFDPMWPERPRAVGVAFVNVESMTAIDRSLSPDVYEKVMVEGARRLARKFGADRVGRLSGEGYVVLMPGLTDPDAVSQASDVAHVLKPIIMVDDIPFGLDPAVGVALSPDHGRELDVLVRRAQLAVGEARRSGKPAAVYVKQAQDAAERRAAVLAELHNALLDTARHEEIAVAYQPQVELATGRLVGAEALVRWLHPEWGPVRADELVEAVESTEVMHLLTLHMLDRVSAQLGTWRGRGHELRVAVNVSMQDLHDPAFPAQISEVLRRHGIPPSLLTVEITERMLTGDAGRVKREAMRVAELGVGLSLDDFGTGYASLQQLRALPLTEVKIDKSYVNEMADDPAQRAIVMSVHQLATALGLAVVAEGVENERTVADLAQLRGTIGQGWYFGRPVNAQVFEEEWHLQPHGQ
jgi:predicted signal transduction protein with EAL and GGDEF domain